MKKSWLFPIIPALCLVAVAFGVPSAGSPDPDGDEDGQTLAARPGMARLYLIEGFVTDGPVSRESVTDGRPDFFIGDTPMKSGGTGVWVPSGPPGSPMAVGSLAGLAIGALLKSPTERATVFTHKMRFTGQARYYLGDKKVGETKESQYVAVDLAPGQYEIRLADQAQDGPVASLSLADDEVVFLVADLHMSAGLIFEVCHKDCGDLIRTGHRVPAYPKPGSNIPNF